MPIQRRPYHAGSQLGPAPAQALEHSELHEWLVRVRGYWTRPNAMARDVASALLSFRGPNGELRPSMPTIARRIGCSMKTVQRWITAFVRVGFLQAIRRRTIFGQTSNAYLLVTGEPQPSERAAFPEQSSKLSSYNKQEDSFGEASKDSLVATLVKGVRQTWIRRFNQRYGAALLPVGPEPQPPTHSVEGYIAVLEAQMAIKPG